MLSPPVEGVDLGGQRRLQLLVAGLVWSALLDDVSHQRGVLKQGYRQLFELANLQMSYLSRWRRSFRVADGILQRNKVLVDLVSGKHFFVGVHDCLKSINSPTLSTLGSAGAAGGPTTAAEPSPPSPAWASL